MLWSLVRPSVRSPNRGPAARRPTVLSLETLDARINPSTLDQVYDPTGATTIVSAGLGSINTDQERAQTFQVGMTGTLAQVDVYVYRFFNTVHGDLIMDIRATQADGRPTSGAGQVLATKTIPSTAVPVQTDGFVAFDLSATNLQITAGEKLAIVLHVAPDPSGDVTYQWNGSTGDPYQNGTDWERELTNHDWVNELPDADLGFRTWVTPPVSQPPVVTLPTGPVAYAENDPATPVDPAATVTDPDSPNFNGGTLTAWFAANGTADDRLAVRNQGAGAGEIGVSGTTVTFGGTAIGTVGGGSGGTPLTVALNANATPAATQVLARNLTYSNGSDDPSTAARTVQVVLTDGGGGTSSPVTTTVTVAAVNDPPALTTSAGLTANEGAAATIGQSALLWSDPDNAAGQIAYTVTAAPAHGQVLLNGTPTSSFTQADVNAGRVSYRHDGSETTADGFTYTVGDGTATGPATAFAVTVSPVNDPPTVTTNAGLSVLAGQPATITAAKLAAADPDNTAAQLTYTVTVAPTHGTVRKGGSPVGAFTQADVDAGTISYLADGSGTSDAFTFTVTDGQAVTGSATFDIAIRASDAAPQVLTNAGLEVARGSTTPIGHAALDAVDADDGSGQLVYTVTAGPAHGTLLRNGSPAATFTQADVDAGLVGYAHDGTAATADGFTFTVSDGTLSTGPATFAIAIDTAPQVTVPPDNVSAFAGSPVTLTAAATGGPGPTVRWQVMAPGGSFVDIPGATAPTYTFLPTPADAGSQYRAVFANPVGTATTAAATLSVIPGLAVLSEPASQTVVLGGTATFTAAATGSTKVAVRWQVSTDGGATYTNIPGATKPTLAVTRVSAIQDGNLYRAVFRNVAGVAPSAPAKLTVNYTVTLAGKRAVAVRPGTAVTFAVQSKALPASVQWQVSIDGGHTWSDVTGATGVTYTLAAAGGDSGHRFRATVVVGGKVSASPAATLTVTDPPAVTASPVDQTAPAGRPARFTVAAAGTGVKVQWQVSTDGGMTFTNIKGATKATLTLRKATAVMNGWVVRGVFAGPTGVAASGTAMLTVV